MALYGDKNPAKRPEVRKRISETIKRQVAEGKIIPWNKGKRGIQVGWNKGKKGVYIPTLETLRRQSEYPYNYLKD